MNAAKQKKLAVLVEGIEKRTKQLTDMIAGLTVDAAAPKAAPKAAKRGPGRPKKTEAAAPAKAKRGPGRPKKTEATNLSEKYNF